MESTSPHTAQSDAIDPICGMTVDTAAGKPSHIHDGEVFHFCSQGCHDKFVADPEHYISGAHRQVVQDTPSGTLFICLHLPDAS